MDIPMMMEPDLRISYDEMEAYLTLSPMITGQNYSYEYLMSFLERNGVTAGIDQFMVRKIAVEQIYNRELLVARGTSPIDGLDAYYDYNFNTHPNSTPDIRADGTVDYWSIHSIETVEKGQVIAIYNEPVPGVNGFSVKGKTIAAKRGRPLLQLRGKGFERSVDNRIYTATQEGKIEINGGRVFITPVYEIFGNVDVTTGNVDFHGDVVIHGNVAAGAKIHATGTVTIDGTAEACEIIAKKDVVIRGGMLGAGKGCIETEGNVAIKFAEYAVIKAYGMVQTNSLLNCDVSCGDKVYLKGKGSVIGGTIYCVCGAELVTVGNDCQARTQITIGATKEFLVEINELEKEIANTEREIHKIDKLIQQYNERIEEEGEALRNSPTRVSILRTKIVKQAELAASKQELENLRYIVNASKDASVRVSGVIYPGSCIGIHALKTEVHEMQKSVEFMINRGNLVMFSLLK